ncbi:hypothetical protein IVB08_00205 [Bradyrhizobium sp. 173]|uniref:hypothetical protein n=1 Tax=Bradyrhizobium sp. 173 TaxID=2782644 RepID=UPI001FFBEB21|nr:hypothetical protein [Bradyrhizobium sp. 173]MCK1562433.1 hypothetical protein [Bradyrhizobium sp. 173]
MKFINTIQMAYFTVPRPDPIDAAKVWELFYHPNNVDEFRRIPNSPGKQTVAASTSDKGQIAISSQIGRIDVTVSALPDVADVQPFLENPSAALAELAQKADLLRELCPLVRGAFVVNQLFPIEGSPTNMIEERTGAKFPANSIDPTIQYNIQVTENGSPPFLVNQISTWSVVSMQLLQFDTSGANPFAVNTDQHLNHKVDVNTAPNQPLNDVDVVRVFKSLSSRAVARIENPLSGSDA